MSMKTISQGKVLLEVDLQKFYYHDDDYTSVLIIIFMKEE